MGVFRTHYDVNSYIFGYMTPTSPLSKCQPQQMVKGLQIRISISQASNRNKFTICTFQYVLLIMLHDSPIYGSHFKMRVDMKVWSDISYIHYYFLPRFTVSCMKLVMIFYSIITFSYTKYLVHSFTVDVVFTLSYLKMRNLKELATNDLF